MATAAPAAPTVLPSPATTLMIKAFSIGSPPLGGGADRSPDAGPLQQQGHGHHHRHREQKDEEVLIRHDDSTDLEHAFDLQGLRLRIGAEDLEDDIFERSADADGRDEDVGFEIR